MERILCFIYLVALMLMLMLCQANAEPTEDKEALLDLVEKLPPSRPLNWNATSSPCTSWTGVTCDPGKSRVIAIRLPGFGFHGTIPPNTISRVTGLQTLSLRSNFITGHFPSDFSNLRNLSFLYLQFNNFTGPLPDFSAWRNLSVVNLSNNCFTGCIPLSLSNLTNLSAMNLANNSLSGEIPVSLRRFPKSAFVGNNVSLEPSPPVAPFSKPAKVKHGEALVLGVVAAVALVGLAAFVVFIFVCCSRKRNGFGRKLQKGDMSPGKVASRDLDANNKLVFFEGCSYAFDLEDLLRASAEVLGKGTFGAAYKAALEDATTVVVKRLKEVAVGRKDFEQHMEVVGNLKHENVVELKGYYYSKDEKLMVYDYYTQGSLSALLHGKRGEDRVPLDWDARMKIALGAARGLARIHCENGGKLVHGNIRSSNIFLNAERYGCVSDLGLATIMSSVAIPISRAAGYRAPEVTDTRKATQPSDVFSFGVVLLELLTGKSPVYTTGGDEIVHLVRWVHSVVREEWTAEVFDLELIRYPNIEEEMVEMLQIAMSCVVRVPDQRPKMSEVVKMIETVRQIDIVNQPSSENQAETATQTPSTP
ncbi:inactive receptor kinase [Spatholobus suberectus]|nr:inactive receptor kinase [Spatholobus suberectus]